MSEGRYAGPPSRGGIRPSREGYQLPGEPAARAVPVPRAGNGRSSNPAEAIGVLFLLLFLFLAYSRVLDLNKVSSLHIPLITSLLALLAALLSGGVKRALTSRPGVLLALLTIWLMIGLPFGTWRSNSLEILRVSWSKSVLMFILTAGLLTTVNRCRKAMFTVGLAAVVITVMCLYFRAESETGQRIWLPSGVLENSNDLAQILLIGLPFCGLAFATRATNLALRLVAVIFIPLILYVIFQTGSRSALVTLITVSVVILFNVSAINKVKMISAIGVAMLMFLAFVSSNLKERYGTLFKSEGPMLTETEKAASSADQRRFVLKQSLILTLRNPVFGIGMGNFQSEAARIANEWNRRAAWLETHNTYTQVSSECGLPALFIFCAILWYCIRNTFLIYKATSRYDQLSVVSGTTFCQFLALINFALTIAFSSVAYQPYMPTLVGIGTALILSARQEIAEFEAHTGITVLEPTRKRALARPGAAVASKPAGGLAPASRSLRS